MDKQLLELKQTNNDEELVQHEKYVDLNEKIYEMQNTGELYTNSKACIKWALKETLKFAIYEQLPFIYRLKLYPLFINGKN